MRTTRTTRTVATAAVTVVAVVALAGCGGGGPSTAERISADVEFVGVVDPGWHDQAMVDASVRLASALVGSGEGNVVVSPLSLQLALAMLREGASGVVADEIDAVAGTSGSSQSIADLRAMLAEYEGDVAGIDPDNPPATPLLHIANSAFVQPGYPVSADFLDRVVAYHLAQVFEADFAAGKAKPLLDAWVKEETGGLLTECPAEVDAETLLVLMNTVTFGATWLAQFDPADTYDGPFTRADGTEVTAQLMHETLTAPYAVGDGWVAAELPYTDGFAMRVLLPDAGTATVGQWQAAHEALAAASGVTLGLTMPSWQTDTTLDLTGSLADLGLGSLTNPAGGLDGVFVGAVVSKVAQGATITVGEKGTVAAAVTAIAVTDSAAAPPDLELRLDRPFEYQVIDQSTGLVLFAGRVVDPS